MTSLLKNSELTLEKADKIVSETLKDRKSTRLNSSH